MNEEGFIPIPERVALLQKLGQPVADVPTAEAARALKILQSLQDNPPQNARARRKVIKNPITRTEGSMIPTSSGYTIQFQDMDTGFNRPQNQKPVDTLGTQATINQLINEIPTREERKRIGTRVESRYTFSPLQDEIDQAKQELTGKPTNQRASAYKRNTKGAFTAYPSVEGDYDTMVGYGERIKETTWQPRDAKRRFGKHVQFDTTDVVKQLGKIGARKAAARGIAATFGPKAQLAAEAVMLADDFLENLLGTAPSQMFKNYIDQQYAEGKIQTPITLIKP